MTKEQIKLVMQWCLPLDTTENKLNNLLEVFIKEHKEAIYYAHSSQLLLCKRSGIWSSSLTEGKKYELISEDEETYILIDNTGRENHYFKDRFTKVNAQ